jgi:hypothetical protein
MKDREARERLDTLERRMREVISTIPPDVPPPMPPKHDWYGDCRWRHYPGYLGYGEKIEEPRFYVKHNRTGASWSGTRGQVYNALSLLPFDGMLEVRVDSRPALRFMQRYEKDKRDHNNWCALHQKEIADHEQSEFERTLRPETV